MAMLQPTMETIEIALTRAIHENIEKAITAEIEGAKDRLEKSIRSELGRIALTLMNDFSIERYGNDLRIIVKNQVNK